MASQGNFGQRDIVRQVVLFRKYFDLKLTLHERFRYKIKRIFLIGSPTDDQTIPLIEREVVQYNDILIGNFPDEYKSVSKKVFMGMRFVKIFCRKVPLITIIDDDAIVFPWNYFPMVFKYHNEDTK